MSEPEVIPYGMTTEQLVDAFEAFMERGMERILGPGRAYALEGRQGFEDMPLDELFEMAGEELEDLAAYAAMLQIRMDRVRDVFKTRGLL